MGAGVCNTRGTMKALQRLRFIAAAAVTGALLTFGLTLGPSAPAQSVSSEEAGFQAYLQLLSARARGEGVREATIQRMTQGLTFNPRVIQLDRGQPGGLPSATPTTPPAFEPYRRQHVDAARINGGRAAYARAAGLLPRIERQYGVPGQILTAIWGHETNYGSYKGNFDLSRSLATLAFEGRRRDLFADEWVALLKIADQGVPREQLVGSWAGAFGNPQFLPSMYLRLARDGDGDGRRDIMNSTPDTLASIANYFRDAGWRQGVPWGVAARVPADFDRGGMTTRLVSPVCPRVHARFTAWKTVGEWRALGVRPQAAIADDVLAVVLEPDGPGRTAYLLTGNYRVILEYNCSNYYALSVGLLADEIAR